MGTLVVVANDPVSGTDKHNVSGTMTNPSPPPPSVPYMGIADFDYVGSMTDALTDFVRIDGAKLATVSSKSSLDPGETAPTGNHAAPAGSSFVPPLTLPSDSQTVSITDSIGTGVPSATGGSAFVKAAGSAVLLDGDSIDTCDGLGIPMNSTVAADGQVFVSCSE
jgi:hypothetical protein